MLQWIREYWFVLFGGFALCVIVSQRMRRRGGDESLLRRIEYALFPHTDPANPHRRDVTPGTIGLVAGGLVVIALFLLFIFVSGF